MRLRRLSTLVVASLSVAFFACGGAVESPAPTGPAPSASGSPDASAAPPSAPTPTPTATTVPSACMSEPWSTSAFGCGDFQIVVAATTHEALLVISGDRSALGLQRVGDATSVDLSGNGQRIDVRVEHYGKALGELPYCSDVLPSTPPPKPSIARAVSGRAIFTLSGVGREGGYAMTMTLQGVMVRQSNGTLECIPDAMFNEVAVGWLPG